MNISDLTVKIGVDSSELDAVEKRVDALLPKLREAAQLNTTIAEPDLRHIGSEAVSFVGGEQVYPDEPIPHEAAKILDRLVAMHRIVQVDIDQARAVVRAMYARQTSNQGDGTMRVCRKPPANPFGGDHPAPPHPVECNASVRDRMV